MRLDSDGKVGAELALGALAQPEGEPVEGDAGERLACGVVARGAHEHLLERGGRLAGQVPRCSGSVGTSRQPRTSRPSSTAMAPNAGLLGLALGLVERQERHADGVAADGRQLEVDDRAQEGVRDLGDDARAVAGAGVGADGTAVLEVAQRVEGVAR